MSDPPEIRKAYDGSALSFRSLEAWGWGPLVNLGYYPLVRLPLLVTGLAHFQRKLAREAVRLLDPKPDERVLEVASGQGWTANHIAQHGSRVLGIDLLAEHVERAEQRFGGDPNLEFEVADATRLPERAGGWELGDASVDRVLCLEAAFHFGPEGRHAFLGEAWRVLRPGGRLVLVDFVWSDEHPERIDEFDSGRIVRDTWRFEQFEPLARYRRRAAELGFRESKLLDWTSQVTTRFVFVAWVMSWLTQNPVTRLMLFLVRPQLFPLWSQDWSQLLELMRAHRRVQKSSRYFALVFDKPVAPAQAGESSSSSRIVGAQSAASGDVRETRSASGRAAG